MSTFNGKVTEIPYIRVDRFDNEVETAKIFFLTHCHTDHMEGLNPEFFDNLRGQYLYASQISVRILKNKFPGYERYFKEISVEESTLLTTTYNNDIFYLNVYVIPAEHCPGSVMFLFETDKKRVLYTGDFRIDHTDEFMNRYFKHTNRIDNIYLDTTFCKKQYAFFPSREETLQGLCNIIEDWLHLGEQKVVKLDLPASYGSEYLFMQIVKKTKQIIHVSDVTYNLYKYIPDMDGSICCTDDDCQIRIHACYKSICHKLEKTSKQDIREIRISAMIWKDYKPGDSVICSDNIYRVCASYHPSYSEICEFIAHLKPRKIVPCVVPKTFREQCEMQELLDNMLLLHTNAEEDPEKFVINQMDFINVQSRNIAEI